MALLILGVGVLIKPKKLAEEPVLLSETSPIQALSRRIQFQDMADFLGGQVASVGAHLLYLDGQGGGVVWAAPDSVVTAGGGDFPILLLRRPAGSTGVPVVRSSAERLERRGWVLIAARQHDGTIASAVGMSGGRSLLLCGNRTYRELIVATPLAAALLGGGMFDLEGNLVGIVGRCGDRPVAISVDDLDAAIEASASPEARLLRSVGFRTSALDSLARRYFAAGDGALIDEVVARSLADRAGLRPGDVVTRVDSVPVQGPGDLADLLGTGGAAGRTLVRIRGGRSATIRLIDPAGADDSATGLELAPDADGFPLADVRPGGAADRAGLRPGDRILSIGGRAPATPAQARLALERSGRPFYLVYERDGSRRGAFLLAE